MRRVSGLPAPPFSASALPNSPGFSPSSWTRPKTSRRLRCWGRAPASGSTRPSERSATNTSPYGTCRSAVINQTAFLRRQSRRLIHFHQILGKDDPSLQLLPSRICTFGKIDCASRLPVIFPLLGACQRTTGKRHKLIRSAAGAKAKTRFESVPVAERIYRWEFGSSPICSVCCSEITLL